MLIIPNGREKVFPKTLKVISRLLLSVLLFFLFTSLKAFDKKGNMAFDPVCIGSVNITINPGWCYAHIRVSSLLLGDYEPGEYNLQIFDLDGNNLGDTIPGRYAGQTLSAEIDHQLSDFTCTVAISVYDESAPQLQLPKDTVLTCNLDPDPVVTGTATATDCTPVTVTYEDEWTETYCGDPKIEILRVWTATDAQGLTATDTQYIDVVRATAADLRFPDDVDYTCRAYKADPNLTDAREEKAGIPTLVNNPRCGLIYTYADQYLPICGDPQTSFIILRKWTVLDACGSEIFSEDGAGNDNMQLIRVLDKTAPLIEPVIQPLGADVRKEDSGFEICSSTGFIPPPDIVDECNSVNVRIFSSVGELEYVNGIDGAEGGHIPFPGLIIGTHQLFYEATDACGNVSSISVPVEVVDDAVPIMLCDQEVTVSLSLDGRGRLEPFMIDKGIRDNCCLENMQIKWIDEPFISFRGRIDIYCLSEPRPAILRAWDCQGNFNECETTVVTHDPLHATIFSVPDEVVEVDCGTDWAKFSDQTYLAPVFQDNCPMNILFSVRDSINECGTVDLWRAWTLQDHPDHQTLRVGQLIRFIDQEPPQLIVEPQDPFCDPDGDCQEMVRFTFSVAENCSEALTIIHRLSLEGGPYEEDSLGKVIREPEGYVLEGVYPIGEYTVHFTVADACGNEASGSYPFSVRDCTPPELSCLEFPDFAIGEDQQIVLGPEDFVELSADACSAVNLNFADAELENIRYDCDSLGLKQVSIWATDSENNRSKCTVDFTVSREGPGCQPLGNLTGRIINEAGEGVALVQLDLNGPDTLRAVTDQDGYYRFESIPLDTDYELKPFKEINPNNGVSVLDIIRISRHILGLDYMINPLQLLASDVNKSGSVTTMDIIAARRIILGLSDHFGDHSDSWRFLPENYIFQNPDQPLDERVPAAVSFKLILEETAIDFIGVKYGDVNVSADPAR